MGEGGRGPQREWLDSLGEESLPMVGGWWGHCCLDSARGVARHAQQKLG